MFFDSRSSWTRALLVLTLVYGCSEDATPRGGDQGDGDDDAIGQRDDERPDAARPGALDGGKDTSVADQSPVDASRPSSRIDASRAGDAAVGADAGEAERDAGEEPRDARAETVDARVTEPGPTSCPTELVGWATQSGSGTMRTTGGGSAAPVRPKTVAELLMYAEDEQPRVIEIAGSFDAPRLAVSSNKTLVGVGKDATIRGGIRIRGKADAPISNVIIRNLRVDGATTASDGDAVQLYFAHHVWIDHCEIWDGPDGNLDMTHAVDLVTVSWTKIRYTENYQRPQGESSDHRFASLLGHSDNNADEDSGRLRVTFHHNWWAERVIERMPRVRFGQVHVFNNYFASPENNYCVRAGRGARLLIEDNYFDHVNSPHEFNNSEDEPTAHMTVRNNVYDGTTGNRAMGGGGTPFTDVPYQALRDPADRVPATVRACAGPR